MVQTPNKKERGFGHLKLKFGIYLEFGICHLEFQCLTGSVYAGVGTYEQNHP
jgi:hypothetical protein